VCAQSGFGRQLCWCLLGALVLVAIVCSEWLLKVTSVCILSCGTGGSCVRDGCVGSLSCCVEDGCVPRLFVEGSFFGIFSSTLGGSCVLKLVV
jgi:hypothetical protein